MSSNEDVGVKMSALEVGMINAIGAIAIALKASPGFNNDALTKIAQKFIDDKVPLPYRGEEAEEAYARPLRMLVSDQAQVIQWLAQDEVKH